MWCGVSVRPVEVSPDELLNSILALSVEVLKLMHGGELLYVEPIGSDNVCVWWQKDGEIS